MQCGGVVSFSAFPFRISNVRPGRKRVGDNKEQRNQARHAEAHQNPQMNLELELEELMCPCIDPVVRLSRLKGGG